MTIGCGEFTREKWERFEYLLRAHLSICRTIIAKRGFRYAYLDFYAGPGVYSSDDFSELSGELGSPIRAIQIIEAFGVPHHVFLFDDEPEVAARLARNLKDKHAVGSLDCATAVDQLVAGNMTLQLGLGFFDPNGQADWPAIGKFSAAFRYIDLLINVNSALIKRMNNPIHKALRPTAYLRSLGKKHIYLWDPCPSDRHQFALAFCTNYGEFPEFRSLGFHSMGTPKGKAIARRIDHSQRERDRMGGISGLLSFGGEHVY